jgi:predicted nucleic acid-binding protein
MARRADAYVDTSALIAFIDRSDSHHIFFRQLFSSPPSLLTTSLVVSEGHAWFLRRYDRNRGLQFLAMIEEMLPLSVSAVGSNELRGATAVLRKYSDRDLTMTDALGLHMIESLGVESCWSTDFHLGLTGVPLVIHRR